MHDEMSTLEESLPPEHFPPDLAGARYCKENEGKKQNKS